MPVSLAEKHTKAETGILHPEFGFAEFWSFCSWLFLKQEFSDAKQETGKQSQEFCFAEFLSFCAFAEKNAVSLTNKGCKGSQNSHVDRTLVSGDILWRWQKYYRLEQNIIVIVNKDNPALQNPARFLHKKSGKQSQKAQLFAVLAQGIYTKHEYFNAKTLVGMTGFGT